MCVIRRDRLFLACCTCATLASFLAWFMLAATPPPVLAAELPLGLATGTSDAQLSLDGKHWAPLPTSSRTVHEGTMIRTGKGASSVLLKEGTQLELQPRTLIGLSGSRTAPIVKIAAGRVLFRMPASSRATFATPTVRYHTAAATTADPPTVVRAKTPMSPVADAVGEITVNSHGGSRLSMQQGELMANSVGDPGLHLVKAGQSVEIPQAGSPDPSFSVLLAQALPAEPAGTAVDTATLAGNGPEGAVSGSMGMGGRTGTGTATMVGTFTTLGVIGAGVGLGVAFSGDDNGKASPSTPSN